MPIEAKANVSGQLSTHQVQGPRPYQEDRWFASLPVLVVLDGHGGEKCAEHCVSRLPSLVAGLDWEQPSLAILNLCTALAAECRDMQSGAALSIVHIGENVATVGILGDAPVIIVDANGDTNVSPEHNVRSNRTEAEAATARGGDIYNGYVCNQFGSGLQMSRALGDRAMGRIISNIPEIYQVPIGKDSLILVATDGVVDPTHQDSGAHSTIAALLRSGATAEEIIKAAGRLQDNATAIVWKADRA